MAEENSGCRVRIGIETVAKPPPGWRWIAVES